MSKAINIIIKLFVTLIFILLSSACGDSDPCIGCGEDINNVNHEILELTQKCSILISPNSSDVTNRPYWQDLSGFVASGL